VGKAATFLLLTALPMLVLAGPPATASGPLRPAALAVFAAGGVLYYVAAGAYILDIKGWLRARRAARG